MNSVIENNINNDNYNRLNNSNKVVVNQIGNIEVIDYSDKAFALRGNTRVLINELKSLYGRYNPNLRDEKGKRFKGWIFSKKRYYDVIAFLDNNMV